jgi:O-antigen chain-terminating methyltransferase
MTGNVSDHDMKGVHSLERLIASLPEVYQPIFGHPEYSVGASRDCDDRLADIVRVYRTLEHKLNRPLRVLDLGCAQGFFSFSLASLGASVVGIDYQRPNIEVCQAVAAECPGLSAEFHTGNIEQVISRLEGGEYDLVLGLSVFHHLVHQSGVAFVQKLLTLLATHTAAGLYEMAMASEPPAWARSQPQNPRQLLNGYVFVHRVAQYATHLSGVLRPLYVASNRYWLVDGEVEPLAVFE